MYDDHCKKYTSWEHHKTILELYNETSQGNIRIAILSSGIHGFCMFFVSWPVSCPVLFCTVTFLHYRYDIVLLIFSLIMFSQKATSINLTHFYYMFSDSDIFASVIKPEITSQYQPGLLTGYLPVVTSNVFDISPSSMVTSRVQKVKMFWLKTPQLCFEIFIVELYYNSLNM